MTKDEMKDRISMALKAPVLQQGFEIICKENAELKKKLKPENCLKLLAKEGYVKFSSVQLDKAKDLIRNLLRVTYGEGWNYSLDWKVKAEKFLEETK